MLGRLKQFCCDESGSIIVQATLFIVTAIGIVGLALDASRLFITQSNLQEIADAAALAGAKQLDGLANAISRANAAAHSLSADIDTANGNRVLWADNSAAYISSVTFSATLGGPPTTNDKIAKYVQVTTGQWGIVPTLIAFFTTTNGVGVNHSTSRTQATATAVSDTTLCIPASMLLCNPNETAASTGNASEFAASPGKQYIFSTAGNTGGFSPGVFNLLDDNGDGSDPAIKKLLSLQTAGQCTTGGVGPAQGQKTSATEDAINVRFGISPQGPTTGMDTSAAPVKIDGMVPSGGGGNHCTLNRLTQDTPLTYSNCTSSSASCRLPRDRNFTAVGGSGGSQIGDIVNAADLQTYWTNQHGGTLPAGLSTRYGVYNYEVTNATTLTWLKNGVETYAPNLACVSGISSTGALRRVVHVAIVDCNYWGVQGNSFNSIRINKYADFFLTEASPDGNIYTEYVQSHQLDEPGSGLHTIVRLVR